MVFFMLEASALTQRNINACFLSVSFLPVSPGVWRPFHQRSGPLSDPGRTVWIYLFANDSTVRTHVCIIQLDRSRPVAPLILPCALISQGDACAAAPRAVCVFPRGLCHVLASDQHPGRTLDPLKANSARLHEPFARGYDICFMPSLFDTVITRWLQCCVLTTSLDTVHKAAMVALYPLCPGCQRRFSDTIKGS